MLSLLILPALLLPLTSARSQITTSERVLLTSNSLYRPLVTKTYDELIYVSFPREPTPKIRLESEKIGYRACELALPQISRQQYPLSLDSLANGRLVLAIIAEAQLLSLVLEPDACESWQALETLEISGEESPAIVVGEEAFDVFLPRHVNCSAGMACRLRYNERAVLVGTTDFQPGEEVGAGWSVSSVAEKDFSRGYLCTRFANGHASSLKLDQYLKVESTRQLGKLFLYSDLFGQVSSCRVASDRELECASLDEELVLKQRAVVDAQPYRPYLRAARLISLPAGAGSLVYLVLQLDGRGDFVSYLQRIDAHGRVSRPLPFQEDVCKDLGRVSASHMQNGLVCLSISCRHSIRTKCVLFVD